MTNRAFWWYLLALFLLLGNVTDADAQVYVAKFPPNPGVLPGGGWQYAPGTTFGDPPGPRAWTNGKYGGIPQFKATDLYRLPGPSGAIPVAVVSTAGLGGAAVAVGRCVVGLNPICAAGTAAYLVYDKYRARPVTGDMSQVCGGVPCNFPSGQFDYDPGQGLGGGGPAPASSGCWWQHNSNPIVQSQCNQAAAIDYWMASNPSTATQAKTGAWAFASEDSQGVTYRAPVYCDGCAHTPQNHDSNVGRTLRKWACPTGTAFNIADASCTPGATAAGSCPPSIDALDPAYNIPGGAQVGPDGKCPSGRHNHVPKTPEEMADIVSQYPPQMPNADWGRAVSDAIDLGGQQAPASLSGSGPASSSGTPKTETKNNPDGTTSTTTTTPTSNYTYNNTTNNYPSVTYTTVNNYSTQTCTGGGSCTTTGGGSSPGPSSGEPAQDPEDPCVKDPGRLSCMKVGEEPAKETIPSENVPATYTPTVFAAPSGCPAPINFAVNVGPFNRSFELGYTPMCDTLGTIRLIFLAVGAVAAAWIFQDGFFKL